MSIRKNLYDFIRKNGLGKIKRKEFENLIDSSSWPRSLRTLRSDEIVDYEFDRSSNTYCIKNIGEYTSSTARSQLNDKIRYRILNRDNHTCQACGKTPSIDGVKLHVDHRIPVAMGGSHNDDNLWTLCAQCNQGKKNFFRDELDSDIMRVVFKEKSGYQRLLVLFKNSPNVYFEPSTLEGISRIRDWTRTIRTIRKKYDMDITYVKPDKKYPNGAYVYKP